MGGNWKHRLVTFSLRPPTPALDFLIIADGSRTDVKNQPAYTAREKYQKPYGKNRWWILLSWNPPIRTSSFDENAPLLFGFVLNFFLSVLVSFSYRNSSTNVQIKRNKFQISIFSFFFSEKKKRLAATIKERSGDLWSLHISGCFFFTYHFHLLLLAFRNPPLRNSGHTTNNTKKKKLLEKQTNSHWRLRFKRWESDSVR